MKGREGEGRERETENEKENESGLQHRRRRRYILREDLVTGKLVIRLFDEIISLLIKGLLDGQP